MCYYRAVVAIWRSNPLYPSGRRPQDQGARKKMKLDRRTVLAGTAAAFAAPIFSAIPARADAKRQALVDSSRESARKTLTGKDYPDAAKYIQGARGVLIVPELVQGGLIFGLAGGRGTLMGGGGPRAR